MERVSTGIDDMDAKPGVDIPAVAGVIPTLESAYMVDYVKGM